MRLFSVGSRLNKRGGRMKRLTMDIFRSSQHRRGNGIAVLVLLLLICLVPEIRADVVTDWNITAIAVAPGSGIGNLPQARIITLMHLAIHDALNSIEPRYETFSGVDG